MADSDERSAVADPTRGLADVLGRTGDGIAVVDADRRYVYANPAAGRILGRSPEQLRGSDLLDSFETAEHGRVLAHLPGRAGDSVPPFFSVLPGPDGRERDVLCTTFALATPDQAYCVIVLRELSDVQLAARAATALIHSAPQSGSGTTEDILAGVARLAVEGTRSTACGITVVGDDHKWVTAGGFGFPAEDKSKHAWTAGSITLADLPGGDALLDSHTVVLPGARPLFEASPVMRPFAAALTGLDWFGTVYVPLSWDRQLFGFLGVFMPAGTPAPSPAELAFFEALAEQASVVVTNARLAAALERTRLARELHDSISQALFSMTMHARAAQLSMTKAGLDRSSPLARSVGQLVDLTKGALAEMRALIFELRPGALAEEGLVAALGKQAAALSAREPVTIVVRGPQQRLDLAAAVEEHLYRIVSEALHNVVKHANATAATVTVTTGADALHVAVVDDGAGFDPTVTRAGHLGLSTMAQRAEAIGAQLVTDSAPGAGATVEITLPRTRPDPQEAG